MKLFWLDLETTGLVPGCNEILEIAISEAEFLAPWEAKPVYHAVLYHPGCGLDEFILDMHTKNGLLEDCRKSDVTITDVLEDLKGIIPIVEDKEERPIMAGSTISFDMSFIQHHLPTIAQRFSHRLYDVSAIKLFGRSMGMDKLPKAEAHRAKEDVLESIAHGALVEKFFLYTGLGG